MSFGVRRCQIVAVALLLAGCSGGGDEQAPPESSETAASQSGEPGDETPTDTATPEEGGPPPGVPEEPVATTPAAVPGMGLEAYALVRSGETVQLTFALTVADPAAFVPRPGAFLLNEGGDDAPVDAVTLLDTAGLQRYLVLLDSEGSCLCSDGGPINELSETSPTVFFSATYAAPPEDVTSMTVETPVGALTGVPVTEG